MNAAFRRVASPALAAGAAMIQSFAASSISKSQFDGNAKKKNPSTSGPSTRLLFVGTGSSTGCPKPVCSMLFGPNYNYSSAASAAAATNQQQQTASAELERLRQEYLNRCRTSHVATTGDPKTNKNYRNNPALLVSHCQQGASGECKNFIIDAGKTFREAALRWFPEHQVTSLDAIILTHHHMDAAGGLDDVRGFQKLAQRGTYQKAPQMVPMPLHLSEVCLSDVSQRFPWLFPKQQQSPYTSGSIKDQPTVERHVASFDVQVFEDLQPMNVTGLKVIPLPVWHGDDLISYGFAFTLQSTNIVYISDISRMIPETMEYIMTKLPPTDILIVDALLPEKPHSVHYSMKQAIELSKQLNAKQTYLVGMNCDAFPLHDVMNEQLQKEGGKVQLAYDGQVINL